MKTPNGDIVEERSKTVVHAHVGRRTYDIENLAKVIAVVLSALTAVAVAVGGVMAVLGLRFTGHGDDLREVKSEIATLHRSDTVQKKNQDSMLSVLTEIKNENARSSRYLCFFLRRMDPGLIEAGDPCQPVTNRRRERR